MFKLILFNIIFMPLIYLACSMELLFSSNWTYQADLLNVSNNNKDIKELTGNVIIKKDSTVLMTEKALIFPNNEKFELSGNITMIDQENILICDSLFHLGMLNYLIVKLI